MNTHGSKITQNYTYEIPYMDSQYMIELQVKFFVKPPDYGTWDSDWDYYGYTEVLDLQMISSHKWDADNECWRYVELTKEERCGIMNVVEELVKQEDPSVQKWEY